MAIRTISKIIPIVLVVTIITVVASNANQRVDPFADYKKFDKKPLAIEEKKLTHYAHEENLIREKLKLDLSQRERAILSGLHFFISVVDDDKKFEFLFTDILLLSSSLKHAEDRVHQKEVVESIIKTSLARGVKHLDNIFGFEERQRWQFMSLFRELTNHPSIEKQYHAFFKQNFSPRTKAQDTQDDKEFDHALAVNDYKRIFDFVLEKSFLAHYNQLNPSHELDLPVDRFPVFLAKLDDYTYLNDHPLGPQLRDLGYLATHVLLVLNNYGEFPAPDSRAWDKAVQYIEQSFDKVSKLGDFDLYAEYIQALKFSSPGKRTSRIRKLENFIYALQRPNGSWGTERDFVTSPYTEIHPTGAALMALNSGNTLPKSNH